MPVFPYPDTMGAYVESNTDMGNRERLSVGQDIEDIAHTATGHPVQCRVTTAAAARHRGELLVLNIQEPGNT